jgi:tetratricopeptide (TPR) repeat protein
VIGISQEELLSELSVLKDSELLYERGIFPQSNYIFKHALTREVVYESILTKKKKDLHEMIGNAIEEVYKENIEEYYEVLAVHYITSENYEKGAKYSRLAGRKAERGASFTDAITYSEKRISCLERLPRTDDVQKQIIDARTTLGLYMFQLFYFEEAKRVVTPIIELALKTDYKKRLSQIYSILGFYSLWVDEDLSMSLKHLEEALKISEEIEDMASSFFSNECLGFPLALNCDFEKAFHHFKKALDINVATNTLWGIALVKSNISRLVYHSQGKINLAYQTSDDALKLSERSGDSYSKAAAYIAHGLSCFFKGFFEDAEKYFSKAVYFSERSNFFSINARANWFLGDTNLEMGQYQESTAHYRKAIYLLEQNKIHPSFIHICKLGIALAKVKNNAKDLNIESLFSSVSENKFKLYDGLVRRCLGEILLYLDDKHLKEAEDWIRKAINMDKQNGTKFYLGQDYFLYSELFNRKGDQTKAKKNLIRSIEI